MDAILSRLASVESPLPIWVLGSMLAYALATNALWLAERRNIELPAPSRWPIETARFLFYVGIPYWLWWMAPPPVPGLRSWRIWPAGLGDCGHPPGGCRPSALGWYSRWRPQHFVVGVAERQPGGTWHPAHFLTQPVGTPSTGSTSRCTGL
jgi:hypothetical protein